LAVVSRAGATLLTLASLVAIPHTVADVPAGEGTEVVAGGGDGPGPEPDDGVEVVVDDRPPVAVPRTVAAGAGGDASIISGALVTVNPPGVVAGSAGGLAGSGLTRILAMVALDAMRQPLPDGVGGDMDEAEMLRLLAKAEAAEAEAAAEAGPGGALAGTVVSDADELRAALGAAAPGDTIVLRQGVYQGRFALTRGGTAEAPIRLRSAPGEWAVLDGNGPNPDRVAGVVEVAADHWHVEHLHLTDSNPDRGARAAGIVVRGRGAATRHLVIHDTADGMQLHQSSGGGEHYGNIVFNAAGRSIETANDGGAGRKELLHNILLNAGAENLRGFSADGRVESYRVQGTIATGAGVLSGSNRSNIAFGTGSGNRNRASGIILERNHLYSGPGRSERLDLTAGGSDLAMIGNLWWLPSAPDTRSWRGVRDEGNEGALRDRGGSVDRVVVERVDRHEGGRGHVVVFNGRKAGEVAADLSGLLQPGQPYAVWNAFDIASGPVSSGEYGGGAVALPMDAGRLAPAAPSGVGTPASTAPEFGVFVVRAGSGGWSAPG
jgi:hypothetical protein